MQQKNKIYKYPFQCEQCKYHAPNKFVKFKPLDDWMIIYPEKNQIHLHFGYPSINEAQSTDETKWVYKNAVENWMKKYSNKKFFIYVDMTRSNDSEYPSDESMKYYKIMMKHQQNSMTVFYGATQAMTFFINMIKHLSNTFKKIRAVETKEEADKLYLEWSKKN